MTDRPDRDIPRLQTLLETVRLLNSTLELKELTAIILEVVRAEIPVERVSVFLVDRSQKVLRPLVTQEIEGDQISLPIGVGIAGTVAATGEFLDIADAYADPRFTAQFDRKSGYYTNDLFALPVCNRFGEVVGVLELLNRLRPITPSDREFLLGISVYIGLALENAYRYSQFVSPRKETKPEPDHPAAHPVDPMEFAMGLLELVPQQGDLPSAVWKHVQKIRTGIDESTDAALKFREFLDEQRDGLLPVDIGAELRHLSELQVEDWERNNIKTTLIAESTPPVYAYAYELRLVLAFLIRSAETGVLKDDSDRKLRLHSWSTGRNVHVSIHHNKPSELGMSRGIAVANFLLQQCHGQIRFESDPDRGTTILIEFPVVHESITE